MSESDSRPDASLRSPKAVTQTITRTGS
jgi:hypothetical protein